MRKLSDLRFQCFGEQKHPSVSLSYFSSVFGRFLGQFSPVYYSTICIGGYIPCLYVDEDSILTLGGLSHEIDTLGG